MKILIVRPGALGDTILTLPIVEAISRIHTGSELTFLGSSQYGAVLPHNIKIESIDSLKWSWIFKAPPVASTDLKPSVDKAFVILKNYQTVTRNLQRAGIQTISASSSPEEGVSLVLTLCRRLDLELPRQKACLDQIRAPRSKRVWIAPGSGSRKKIAPAALFSEACKLLRKGYGFEFDVTLGEPDMWMLEDENFGKFIKEFNSRVFVNKALQYIISTMRNHALFIGNDSGVSHLAAALNVPSVVFFTITDPLVWKPWAPENNLLILTVKCPFEPSNEDFSNLLHQISIFVDRIFNP